MRQPAILIVLLFAACHDPQLSTQQCTETRRETIVTYPNMALQALGPQYTALALTPVYIEQDVCTKWILK